MFDSIVYDIFDNLHEGIIIVNKDGELEFLNKKAAEIDNINRDTAIGRKVLDIYPSLSKKTSTLLKVLKNREPIINNKQLYRNYKGESLNTINSTYPLWKGKRFIGVIEVSRCVEIENKEVSHIVEARNQISNDEDRSIQRKKDTLSLNVAKFDFIDIIGGSYYILEAKDRASKASKTSSPVLIYGETGTGKEMFVQAIHNNSNRREKPFIPQNCAAIPAELMEGILFGTAKGGFTGAEDRKGLFELANGGTLYLDELNSMPLELQGKILRVLQEGNIRRIGDNEIKAVDVRIIASLNEEPEKLVEEGLLRKDLYYRLNVVRINLPTLRKRKEDIPILVDFFINHFNKRFNGSIQGIHQDALKKLISMQWEGNIRELEHCIEGIFNLRQSGYILPEDLDDINPHTTTKEIIPLQDKLLELEEGYIKEALAAANNNVSKAAKLLDVPRQTLQYKIKRMNERNR